MTTTLSSKGQLVLPAAVRRRLALKSGARFACRVTGNNIVLTPTEARHGASSFVKSKLTGLVVTQGPQGAPTVTTEQVRALLTDGHLLELARAHGAQFVTLDGKIPGALLIP